MEIGALAKQRTGCRARHSCDGHSAAAGLGCLSAPNPLGPSTSAPAAIPSSSYWAYGGESGRPNALEDAAPHTVSKQGWPLALAAWRMQVRDGGGQ